MYCALKTESLCQPLTKLPKPAASGSREVTWNQGYTQNKKEIRGIVKPNNSFLSDSFISYQLLPKCIPFTMSLFPQHKNKFEEEHQDASRAGKIHIV